MNTQYFLTMQKGKNTDLNNDRNEGSYLEFPV